MEERLSYDDISIIPERVTNIEHRSECNPFDENGMLPIFAAPMSSVIDINNWKLFCDNKINVVIPRSISIEDRIDILLLTSIHKDSVNNYQAFVSFSMNEIRKTFLDNGTGFLRKDLRRFLIRLSLRKQQIKMHICIDVANGHMKSLLDLISELKKKYHDNIVIMAGNIANPDTYVDYENAGCDYVRCSIGTGKGCLTASNVGIFFPAFSLLEEIYNKKKSIDGKCKIIADGGIDCYRNIQKALIYADYVMIGGLFNQMIESAAEGRYESFYKINLIGKKRRCWLKNFLYAGKIVKESPSEIIEKIKQGTVKVIKTFYGMSTKIAQQEMNKNNECELKTSEGKIITQEVLYDVAGWVENEISYLKSAMSYTNSRTLDEYKCSQYVKNKDIKYNK